VITIAARRLTGGQPGDQASRKSGGAAPLVARSPDRPSSTPKAWVEVSVADTGAGIAAEDLPGLFDPVFPSQEVGKGTGLGLAISQSIVEQHGGQIEIASPGPGRGATVTVRLPHTG
jgi:signal transduction histidine kinase